MGMRLLRWQLWERYVGMGMTTTLVATRDAEAEVAPLGNQTSDFGSKEGDVANESRDSISETLDQTIPTWVEYRKATNQIAA